MKECKECGAEFKPTLAEAKPGYVNVCEVCTAKDPRFAKQMLEYNRKERALGSLNFKDKGRIRWR